MVLKNPDKVIFVDVYKLLIGMSVVDGPEYESLKRFNLNEIYKAATECQGVGVQTVASEKASIDGV